MLTEHRGPFIPDPTQGYNTGGRHDSASDAHFVVNGMPQDFITVAGAARYGEHAWNQPLSGYG